VVAARGWLLRRGALLVAAVAASALAAGCAPDGDGQGTEVEPPDRLTIVRDDGEGTALRIELECDGGDRARCASIGGRLSALEPDPDEVCAEVLVGPDSITVEGRLDGDPVSVRVDRSDSCADARYRLLDELLRPESG
jgi:hypothetical protein